MKKLLESFFLLLIKITFKKFHKKVKNIVDKMKNWEYINSNKRKVSPMQKVERKKQ
ncbi:hypothetical protein FSBG_00232 [Fusobacterium gonidiaformans 3-1-5R]|uniref:Uncharacterized protein n=2 Tax=Fusobacterium TaxID=848 RepID=E5BF54_9FUSO|nr:hypothetical protein FSBG_00232 [Fusobacterium gonidiaformans 3-1-5R]KXA12724.1 hypothetical protein HMPREF3206_01666 [Fusobacterium equinum]